MTKRGFSFILLTLHIFRVHDMDNFKRLILFIANSNLNALGMNKEVKTVCFKHSLPAETSQS
jgi:hypothetical protein